MNSEKLITLDLAYLGVKTKTVRVNSVVGIRAKP